MSQEKTEKIGSWRDKKIDVAESPGEVGTLNAHRQRIQFRRMESFFVNLETNFSANPDLCRFRVRLGTGASNPGDMKDDFLIEISSADGGITASAGEIRVKIPSSATENHPFGPGYRWSVEAAIPDTGTPRNVHVETIDGFEFILVDGIATVRPGQIITIGDQTALILDVDGNVANSTVRDWPKYKGVAEVRNSDFSLVAGGPWECVL